MKSFIFVFLFSVTASAQWIGDVKQGENVWVNQFDSKSEAEQFVSKIKKELDPNKGSISSNVKDASEMIAAQKAEQEAIVERKERIKELSEKPTLTQSEKDEALMLWLDEKAEQ